MVKNGFYSGGVIGGVSSASSSMYISEVLVGVLMISFLSSKLTVVVVSMRESTTPSRI